VDLPTGGINHNELVEAQIAGRFAIIVYLFVGRVDEMVEVSCAQQSVNRLKPSKRVGRLAVFGVGPVLVFGPIADWSLREPNAK
jgi:hypothetical protein